MSRLTKDDIMRFKKVEEDFDSKARTFMSDVDLKNFKYAFATLLLTWKENKPAEETEESYAYATGSFMIVGISNDKLNSDMFRSYLDYCIDPDNDRWDKMTDEEEEIMVSYEFELGELMVKFVEEVLQPCCYNSCDILDVDIRPMIAYFKESATIDESDNARFILDLYRRIR